MLTPTLGLAGGSWIFLGFVVLFLIAVIFGYYTRTGSGIGQREWSHGSEAPGAMTPSSLSKDSTQDVRNWSRGTAGKRRRRMTPLEQRTAEEIAASAGPDRDPTWSARVGATVQLAAPVDAERDHVRGPEDAEVTLVEYGEYECSYCREAALVVAQMEKEFGRSLRVVYRHFPLRNVHPQAEGAALAAEAAGRQGRFWPLHDALGKAKGPLSERKIEEIGEQTVADADRFRADRADPALHERVEADFQSGLASGVNGTPTFFINNVRYDDDFDPAELGEAIEAARRAARA